MSDTALLKIIARRLEAQAELTNHEWAMIRLQGEIDGLNFAESTFLSEPFEPTAKEPSAKQPPAEEPTGGKLRLPESEKEAAKNYPPLAGETAGTPQGVVYFSRPLSGQAKELAEDLKAPEPQSVATTDECRTAVKKVDIDFSVQEEEPVFPKRKTRTQEEADAEIRTHYENDLCPDEIAEKMDVSEDYVKQRIGALKLKVLNGSLASGDAARATPESKPLHPSR
jgi:hypothetical protein